LTTTTNLGLTVYDLASGSSTLFQTYFLALSGGSSNMVLIDDWAGSISGSVVSLKANTIIDVNASMITTDYYEATTTAISTYNTNMKINLILNVSITGTTTLNINGLGVKTLKKVDVSGALVDLVSGDLRINRHYLFIYDGTYFVLIGSQIADQISISGSSGNFVSISGSNVLTDSGVSVLTGVSSGSYNLVNIDQYGRVTSGSVIDYITTGCLVVSGSGVMSDTSGSIVKHNVSGITSGSYNTIQVDSYGHITAGSPVVRHARKTVTTDYTITLNDEKIYSSGSRIILPTAVNNFNDYYIKNIGGSSIVVTSVSGSIDNETSQTIGILDSIFVSSDNANWWIM